MNITSLLEERNITKVFEDLERIVDQYNESQGDGEVKEVGDMVGTKEFYREVVGWYPSCHIDIAQAWSRNT